MFKKVGAFNSTKGIPTSFIDSEQQWDSANAWPPLIHMVIDGFRTTSDLPLINFAQKLATQWLRANYDAFQKTQSMFEKYNASADSGFAGSGGEYEVQVSVTNMMIM